MIESAEDHRVPGYKGEVFLINMRALMCIPLNENILIQFTFSERRNSKRDLAQFKFDQESKTFLESIKYEDSRFVESQEYCDKGWEKDEIGEYDAAIKFYTICITEGNLNDSNLTIAHNNLGIAFAGRGDYDDAVVNYSRAIRLNSNYNVAYNNRGRACLEMHDYEQAVRDFTEGIRLAPQASGLELVFFYRGLAYEEMGNYEKSIADYTKAIDLDPDFWDPLSARCWVYGLVRRPHDALRDCNESLRLMPDDPGTLDSRALAFWLLGEQDKARSDLEEARRIDPSLPDWQQRFREFEELL